MRPYSGQVLQYHWHNGQDDCDLSYFTPPVPVRLIFEIKVDPGLDLPPIPIPALGPLKRSRIPNPKIKYSSRRGDDFFSSVLSEHQINRPSAQIEIFETNLVSLTVYFENLRKVKKLASDIA